MSGCADGAPVMLSNAHFYGADPKYAEAIDGINPDQAKHETFLDIEPVIHELFNFTLQGNHLHFS